MILRWLKGATTRDESEPLYRAIVAAARQESFYTDMMVPDTIDGRFDILSLHLFLVLNRLRAFGPTSKKLSQDLTDRFFADMDAAMREVGVGDLSVGKKVRKMAEAFYGRVKAYEPALAQEDNTLVQALARNVFAGQNATPASALATWVRAAHRNLAAQDYSDFAAGKVRFS